MSARCPHPCDAEPDSCSRVVITTDLDGLVEELETVVGSAHVYSR